MQSLTRLRRSLSFRTLLIAIALLGTRPLRAQSHNAEVADLREQLASLQSRLDALEKQPPSPTPASSVEVLVNSRGLVVEASDDSFTFRIRPRIQVDGLWFPDDADGASGFTLRRVRPTFQGEAGPVFWRFMPELTGTVRILDAWGTVRLSDALSVQAGKFKGPIGHERLQSFSKTLFTERGLPSLLSPTRETGMQLNGCSPRGIVEWNLGIYNGVFDDSDQSNNADLSGGDLDVGARVAFHPFTGPSENLLAGLRFGLAASVGRERATIQDSDRDRRIRYQTSGRNTFFRYNDGVTADGDRVRLNPFLSWYHGPFELLTEYIQSSYDLSRGDVSRTVSTDAMTFQVGWVLTGENAADSGIHPENAFNPSAGKWGALQIGLRYHALKVDDGAFTGDPTTTRLARSDATQQADGYGVALNWFLTNNLLLAINYEHTDFAGRGAARRSEDLVRTRFQIDF